MALVLELLAARDGVIVERGDRWCVLRTFGTTGDGKLLVGIDYGDPQLEEMDLTIGSWHRLTIFDVPFDLRVEYKGVGKVKLIAKEPTKLLQFQRLKAKGGVRAAA